MTIALDGRALWVTWMSQYRGQERTLPSRAIFLAIHLGAIALFAWISSVFFTGQGDAQRAPALWASTWAMVASVAFLSWGHALLPLPRWRLVLRDHRGSVTCGAAVGAVAWAFGFVSESFWEPLAQYTYRILGWMLGLVREVFRRYVAGEGLRTIAESLNIIHAPCPRAQQGRPNGWSFTSIREVLIRPLYRGEVVYGKTVSVYGRELDRRLREIGRRVTPRQGRQREKGQVPTLEQTWTRRYDESLRIVDADLAARADAKRLGRRERYFTALRGEGGRVPERAHGIYLLSGGMLICPTCGGHFEGVKVMWRGSGLVKKQVYVCATRRRRPGVCSNTLELPMDLADNAVLDMVEKKSWARG